MELSDLDRFSDTNSNPPTLPEDYAGSSVSSRLQDEYEELLKYAVVVPKFDVDDLPRMLADSKQTFAQARRPSPPEIEHTSESRSSGSDSEEGVGELNKNINATGAGRSSISERVVTPRYKPPNSESDIQTLTPRTKPSDIVMRGSDDEMLGSYRRKVTTSRPNVVTTVTRPQQQSDSESEEDTELVYNRTEETERAVDESELQDIEKKIDMWTRQLNSNIMDEISRLRLKQIEISRHSLQTAQSRHAGEVVNLQNDLDSMRELLNTYEVSIERKDGVITNLTRSLQNQKEKFGTLRTFTDWKIQFAAKKQEGYGMRLAARHHQLSLKRRCWRMWHEIIVDKWRRRVEKACQAKAQEVCIALTNDYEAKLKSLEEKYDETRREVLLLHKEREYYEESMKKAFMRGVCALNMEAMNMFHESENQPPNNESCGPSNGGIPSSNYIPPSQPMTVQHAPAYQTTHTEIGGKRLTATVTANNKPASKINSTRLTDGSTVLVERHDNTTPQSFRTEAAPQMKHPSRPNSRNATSLRKSTNQNSRVVKIVK